MTAAGKPKWVDFDDLLFGLGGKPLADILGDGDAALHAARYVMFLFLKSGDWVARTTSPEAYVYSVGEHSVPLNTMDTVDPHFWHDFEVAWETGAPYEHLARGGPWAQEVGENGSVDGFAFGLAGDHNGPRVGRVRNVQIWARTGKFSAPGRGERGPGRTDAYGYAGAVARIKADVDAAEGDEAKRRARRDGIARELAGGVGKGDPANRQRHLERKLIKAGCRANAPRKKHLKIA